MIFSGLVIETVKSMNKDELHNSHAACAPVERRVIHRFVCTDCRLIFASDDEGMNAICPECGETYGHFLTKLIRCNTFALAYWLRDCPGEIRNQKDIDV